MGGVLSEGAVEVGSVCVLRRLWGGGRTVAREGREVSSGRCGFRCEV